MQMSSFAIACHRCHRRFEEFHPVDEVLGCGVFKRNSTNQGGSGERTLVRHDLLLALNVFSNAEIDLLDTLASGILAVEEVAQAVSQEVEAEYANSDA